MDLSWLSGTLTTGFVDEARNIKLKITNIDISKIIFHKSSFDQRHTSGLIKMAIFPIQTVVFVLIIPCSSCP